MTITGNVADASHTLKLLIIFGLALKVVELSTPLSIKL
jgi:hypothetical protein